MSSNAHLLPSFSTLPPELRQYIYSLVLSQPRIIKLKRDHNPTSFRQRLFTRKREGEVIDLSQKLSDFLYYPPVSLEKDDCPAKLTCIYAAPGPIIPLLAVCQESRDWVLHKYIDFQLNAYNHWPVNIGRLDGLHGVGFCWKDGKLGVRVETVHGGDSITYMSLKSDVLYIDCPSTIYAWRDYSGSRDNRLPPITATPK
jgi:hypothetical protein